MLGSWSVGGNCIHAVGWTAGCGVQNAALKFGGVPSASFDWFYTEEYNGSSWSCVNDLLLIPPALPFNKGRKSTAAAGTVFAALAMGGFNIFNPSLNKAEEYNGTSWSLAGTYNVPRSDLSGVGTQTAAMMMGGWYQPSDTFHLITEEYDGSTFSIGGNLSTPKAGMGGAGSVDAGLCIGGYVSGINYLNIEEYNGTSWCTGGNLNTFRNVPTSFGTQSSAIVAGGHNNPIAVSTEYYDGTSWSVVGGGDQLVRRFGSASAGTSTAGLSSSGNDDTNTSFINCEEWSGFNLYFVFITANGRIRPSISAIARIRPNLKANGRIQVKVTKNITSNAKIKFIGYEQYLCSRAKLTISRQMKTWDILVKEVTPPFERRVDIPWNARITLKSYKVILNTLARIRKSINDPSWIVDDHVIQATAFIRESFARGKVYQILKDRNFIRLRFITSTAAILHTDNVIESVARINGNLTGNACIVPNDWK